MEVESFDPSSSLRFIIIFWFLAHYALLELEIRKKPEDYIYSSAEVYFS